MAELKLDASPHCDSHVARQYSCRRRQDLAEDANALTNPIFHGQMDRMASIEEHIPRIQFGL